MPVQLGALNFYNLVALAHNLFCHLLKSQSHPYIGPFMYDNPRNLINILPPFPLEPSPVKIVGITSDFYIESLSASPFSTPPFSIFPNPFNPIKVDSLIP